MKSKSEEYNCKGCIFAETAGPDPVQIGCKAGREELYQRKPLTDGYHDLKRFCNMYRDEEWAKMYNDDENSERHARNEISSKFGIVIEDDPSLDLPHMEETLNSLLVATQNYSKDNVGVLMSFGDHERPMSKTLHLSNYYTTEGMWCRGCNQSRDLDIQEREKTLFQQLVFAHYFIFLKVGQTVEPTLFKDIDYSVNDICERNICFGQNGFHVVLKSAIRSYYLDHGSYSGVEKYLVEASKEKGLYKEL